MRPGIRIIDYMQDITELRKEIDEIDREMQSLFERRLGVSRKIGAYKASRGMPIFDAGREEEMIGTCRKRAADPEAADGIEKLYRTIFEISRDLQKEVVGNGSDSIRSD